MKLKPPALAIAFLAPFIAQKDIRYYLNGLNVRPRPRSHREGRPSACVHEPSDAGPPDGDGRGWALVEGRA